jgi:copper oxidase (laccase) domain-containing protein
MFGRRYGDFRKKHHPDEASRKELFEQALGSGLVSANRVTVLRAENFNGNVVECVAAGDRVQFMHTLADGGVIDGPRHALSIANADCPIVAVYDTKCDRLAALHAGFACVKRPDGGPSVMHRLVKQHGFHPDRSDVHVFGGIGPCCYGRSDCSDFAKHTATRGPRIGQPSVNLYDLICEELNALGFRNGTRSVDYTCTACFGRSEGELGPKYHSNVWDGQEGGRNATFVWVE